MSVYIKSIIPEKMKIKLVVLHAMRDETFAFPLEYRLARRTYQAVDILRAGRGPRDRNDI